MRIEPIPSLGLPASPRTSVAREKRGSAISAVKLARPARTVRQVDREILTRIAGGGLLLCETELRYQLARRGHHRRDLLELLADLERRGLIESETHYRLTLEGAAEVPARDRPAAPAISSIPWSSPPRPSPIIPPTRPSRRARRNPAGRLAAPRT